MAYEVIGAKRRYKYYKLPFLTSNDDHVKKIKFTIYDRYDRREALKKFLDASYVRYKLDADEDPTLRNVFVAGQSSYGRMMNTAMKTFVTKGQKLMGTDIRGVKDRRPRVLMENPNSYALFFLKIARSTITKILGQSILIVTLKLEKNLSSLNFVRR